MLKSLKISRQVPLCIVYIFFRLEYETDYKVEYERLKKQKQEAEQVQKLEIWIPHFLGPAISSLGLFFYSKLLPFPCEIAGDVTSQWMQ